MKLIKIILKLLLYLTLFLSLVLLIIHFGSFRLNVGKIYLQKKDSIFLEIHQIEEFRDYDELSFDFYIQGKVIKKDVFFDSTDGDSQIEDYKVFFCNHFYFLTNFDSQKVKIILNDKWELIYPIDNKLNSVKIDSLEKRIESQIMPKLRKCNRGDLKLGKW